MNNFKAHLSDTSIAFWSWLFPVTYLMHIAEEYFVGGGYSEYLMKLRGVHLSPTRFLVSQSIGVVLMIIGMLIARRLGFLKIMLVILGAVVLINGITHTVTSLTYRSYGPGLITSIFVWFPLGVATLIRFHGTIKPRKYWMAVLIGVGINAAIAVFTMKGGRIG
ncbi:MAG: HXXEE domain-containing protein [Pyrinomonadaceae bacterium]